MNTLRDLIVVEHAPDQQGSLKLRTEETKLNHKSVLQHDFFAGLQSICRILILRVLIISFSEVGVHYMQRTFNSFTEIDMNITNKSNGSRKSCRVNRKYEIIAIFYNKRKHYISQSITIAPLIFSESALPLQDNNCERLRISK